MIWLNKIAVIAVLGALMFLRFVDLAVFDPDHGHLDNAHMQVHAQEMAHAHYDGETTEHDSLDAMSAHVGIHTLLGVFLDSAADTAVAAPAQPGKFGLKLGFSATTRSSTPPVPPPLA